LLSFSKKEVLAAFYTTPKIIKISAPPATKTHPSTIMRKARGASRITLPCIKKCSLTFATLWRPFRAAAAFVPNANPSDRPRYFAVMPQAGRLPIVQGHAGITKARQARSGSDSPLEIQAVAAVYTGAMSDPPWQDVVEMLCDRMNAMLMAISFRRVSDDMPSIGVQAFRGQGQKLWTNFHSRFRSLRIFGRDMAVPGRILRLSDCDHINHPEIARLRAESLVPCGAGEAYCLAIGEHVALNTYLVWVKRYGEDLTSGEQAWIHALAPHLERAVEGYYRTRRAQLSCRVLGDALGKLSVGVAAIDHDDRILFSNEIAAHILATSPDIAGHAQRLTVHDPILRKKLDQARLKPQAARICGPDGQAVGILIMAAEGRDELGPGSRPERAIYFHTLSSNSDAPERLVADLYDLSRTEAKLCVLLVDGLTLRECAEKMGISENTARTYSKQVFAKTNVSRQVDLVRLMLRSLMMLGS
jgi:DNA-binding CsgD family transcriptional regulator